MKNLLLHITLFFNLFCFSQNQVVIQKELDNLHANTRKINDSIGKLIKECNSQIKSQKDSITKNKLALRLDELYNFLDQNTISELQLDLEYAKKHSTSQEVLSLINMRMSRFEGMNFYDTFEDLYKKLLPESKNSAEGKKMEANLKYFKQSKVGSFAPEFTIKDIDGKQLSLNDYKGEKYVLIDFWASWCSPCREELPYIKKLYQKYAKEGFEIISITKDENLDSWKRTILKENIAVWRHFSIIENNDSILKDYFVSGIPHKVLIDKTGKIIGKWKGGGENNKHELQQLLRKIFEK